MKIVVVDETGKTLRTIEVPPPADHIEVDFVLFPNLPEGVTYPDDVKAPWKMGESKRQLPSQGGRRPDVISG